MGNAECITKDQGLDSLCAGRGDYPTFVAPNRDNVTYAFDYAQSEDITFAHGAPGIVSTNGFMVEPQVGPGERRLPKSYILKECSPAAFDLRVRVSGRVLVSCSGEFAEAGYGNDAACAFKVGLRGRPVYQSFRTENYTHKGKTGTSGIYFGLFVSAPTGQGVFLRPQIILALESGDEVVLVDDKLGPMPRPQTFFADFSILDDGGRNVQMDLIFRGMPRETESGSPDTGMRTLRTCLQEYTVFNSQVDPGHVTFSSSGMSSLMPKSAIHLQNLVLSEELIDEPQAEARPYGSRRHSASSWTSPWPAEKVLFEGCDVGAAALAWEEADASGQALTHPQMCKHEDGHSTPGDSPAPPRAPRGCENAGWSGPRPAGTAAVAAVASPRRDKPPDKSGAEDFWYHLRYDDLEKRGTLEWPLRSIGDNMPPIRGEFWLTKKAMEMSNVYFHCSATLAQAVTMCVAFRFSCPVEFLTYIECQVGSLLETHIPTNGVVMGVEPDPRQPGLLRMFMEHRNEILEDMVICECRRADLEHTVVHQEIYDGGSIILYRVTLLHKDGTRQSAVLQLDTEKIEEGRDGNTSRMRMVEEPSSRFPLEPCRVYHNLSPVNRVFVYSSSAYQTPEDRAAAMMTPCSARKEASAAPDVCSLPGQAAEPWRHLAALAVPASLAARDPLDGAEDWYSAGGGFSDGEVDPTPEQGRPVGSGARPEDFNSATGSPLATGADVAGEASPASDGMVWPVPSAWLRPLVDGVVLLTGVEEPPFRCFPRAMS